MSDNALDKKLEFAALFDCYGKLLTNKQSEALSLYFDEDLSYQEVADNLGISKQAVHDKVSRGIKTLEEIERKIGFIKYKNKIRHILKKHRSSDIKEVVALIHELTAEDMD